MALLLKALNYVRQKHCLTKCVCVCVCVCVCIYKGSKALQFSQVVVLDLYITVYAGISNIGCKCTPAIFPIYLLLFFHIY